MVGDGCWVGPQEQCYVLTKHLGTRMNIMGQRQENLDNAAKFLLNKKIHNSGGHKLKCE